MVKHHHGRMLDWCDKAIVFSACVLILFLPISIAMVESFSGFVILFFVIKKFLIAREDVSKVTGQKTDSFFFDELMWQHFRRQLILPKHTLRFSLLILMTIVFLSVLFSQDRVSSIIAYVGKFLQGIALMLSLHEGFKQKKYLMWFTGAFLCSAGLVALSGLSQYFFHYEFLRQNELSAEGRISSSLRHPNDLGIYLTIALGINIAWFCSLKSKPLIKGGLIFLFALMMYVLLLTYSRSAWVGFLSLLLFIPIFEKKFTPFVVLIIFIIVGLFLPSLKNKRNYLLFSDNPKSAQKIVDHEQINKNESSVWGEDIAKESNMADKLTNALVKPVDTRFSSPVDTYTDESIVHAILMEISKFGGSGRAEYWDKAIKVIQTAPVLGTGLNTYSKQVEKIPGFWGGGYAHNCYLQMTAETGLLGITAFLYFFFSLIYFVIKALRRMTDIFLRNNTIIGCGILIAYLVQSFFDTTFYSVQLGNLLWIISGLLLAMVSQSPKFDKT